MRQEGQAESAAALQRGLALEDDHRTDDAYACFLQATALDPGNGRAWRQLGNLLRRAGRLAEASQCFERAIAGGDDPALNAFFLSAVGVGPVASIAPTGFVSALYDQYAERFDTHLVQELRYQAPRLLADLLAGDRYAPFDAALDLGCGTGLMGVALGAAARRIDGVDLSARMLAEARKTGLYARLVLADLQQHLLRAKERYDLIVCCDAFIYIGDLQAVFAGARRVLTPQGSFGFTVESCDAELGYDLLPTLRFAHSEPSIRRLAAAHGFGVRGVAREVVRQQDEQPVEGLLVHLALDT